MNINANGPIASPLSNAVNSNAQNTPVTNSGANNAVVNNTTVINTGAPKSGNNVPLNAVSSHVQLSAEGNNVAGVNGNPSLQSIESQDKQSPNKTNQNDASLVEAVETANQFVQTVQRDLHFSIDDDTDHTVVKVVDSSSGDLIRQIPNESFLEMARKMKELGEVSLVDATG